MTDRPDVIPSFATDSGVRVEPNPGKKATGYSANAEPAAGEHNWLFGKLSDWVAFLESRRGGSETYIKASQSVSHGGAASADYFSGALVYDWGTHPWGYLITYTEFADGFVSEDGKSWNTSTSAKSPVASAASMLLGGAVADRVNGLAVVATDVGIQYTANPIGTDFTNKALPAGAPAVFGWDDTAAAGLVFNDSDVCYRFSDLTAGSPFTVATTGPTFNSGAPKAVAYGGGVWVVVANVANSNSKRIHRSTDGGDTWSEATTEPTMEDLVGITYSEQRAKFVAVGQTTSGLDPIGIYESTDGQVWVDVTPSLYDDDWNSSVIEAVVRLDPETILILGQRAQNYDHTACLISYDGGASWLPIVFETLAAGSYRSAVRYLGRLYLAGGVSSGDPTVWVGG